MNKIKLTACILACSVIFGLTGCSTDKDPISAEKFTQKMEEAGLEINDQSDEAPEDLGMSEVRVAFDEGKYQIEFYTFDKEEDAKSMYNYVQENLDNQYENESGRVRTSKSVGNHASYKLSADEKYFVVSRIGNTLVYSAATSDYKNQVKELVEDIGY